MAGDIQNYTNFSGVSVPSTGTIAANGGVLSLGTWSFSMTTAANAAAIPSGHVGLIFAASGVSLVFKSGSTVYTIGGSATSA